MTPAQLLHELWRRGVELSARGDALCVEEPVGAQTADLRGHLARDKAHLLSLLRMRPGTAGAYYLAAQIEAYRRIGGLRPAGWSEPFDHMREQAASLWAATDRAEAAVFEAGERMMGGDRSSERAFREALADLETAWERIAQWLDKGADDSREVR